MKILIFVAVLLAVCGQSAVNVQADVIECEFKDKEVYDPDVDLNETDTKSVSYTCFIKSIQQDENENAITGSHEKGRYDSDVLAAYYYSWLDPINLTNFDSIFCQKFPSLERIDFDNLKPANLDENALYDCQNLNYFRLDHAGIKKIPDNLFSNNEKLTYLGLSYNQLETLPQNIFSSLKKLNRLYLHENKLNYLSENVFKPLTKLKYLWLGSNELSTLSHAWFDNLRNLEALNLVNNKIEDLPKGIFVSLEKLKELFLLINNLVTIHADSFGKKPHLTFVFLTNNKITSIDEKFIDNTAVVTLIMQHNSCTQEIIRSRDKMKEKLKQCFENYQPRQDPSTSTISTIATPASSAAPLKHNIKWNLWLSLSLLTLSFWY